MSMSLTFRLTPTHKHSYARILAQSEFSCNAYACVYRDLIRNAMMINSDYPLFT